MGWWASKTWKARKCPLDVRVVLKCEMNRRAARRPKDVIAAEKAAEKVKKDARDEQKRQQEEFAAQMRKAKRRRIMQQIDHAFQTGHESGSRSLWRKYITCDTCSSPADFIYVEHAASCSRCRRVRRRKHDYGTRCVQCTTSFAHQFQRQYYYKHVAQAVPCSRLEFFYTGIRQIAIKGGK